MVVGMGVFVFMRNEILPSTGLLLRTLPYIYYSHCTHWTPRALGKISSIPFLLSLNSVLVLHHEGRFAIKFISDTIMGCEISHICHVPICMMLSNLELVLPVWARAWSCGVIIGGIRGTPRGDQ